MGPNLELLGMLLEHLVLVGLPPAAAVVVATQRGLRSVPLLLGIALAVSGAIAMLTFWLYYADPLAGKSASFFFVLGSVLVLGWCFLDGIEWSALRPLAVPAALWGLASGFVLFLGFIHGGWSEPLHTAATRFSSPLPSDNELPRYFADYVYLHGHHGSPPPFATWLSSDRPPLQMGYVLGQRPFGWDAPGLHYEVLSLVVQQLWVLAMWALLCAARVTAPTRGLIALAAIVSDLVLINALFVWPKLLAATFALAALALVISPEWKELRRKPAVGALFAALCALSLLSHGASAFFVLPLLGFAALRGLPSPAWVGVAIAVGVLLLAPWSAYQRYADPPGNRLLRWSLGGVAGLDERGTVETITDSYREAGLGGTAENKWANATKLVGQQDVERAANEVVDEVQAGHFGRAIMAIRTPRFFDLLPFLGLLLLGPLAMSIARIRGRPTGPDWRFAVVGLAFCAAACLVWVLLMFGNTEGRTLMHQSAYALPLLAIFACVAGACAVDRRLGLGLVIANVLVVLLLYVPALTPPPGTAYSKVAAVLAAAALAGIGWITLRPLRA